MEQFKEHDFVRLEKTGEIAIIKGKRIFDEYSAYRVLNGKLKEGMGIRGTMRLATQSEIDNFLNSLVNYNLYWTGQRIRRYPRIGRKYFYINSNKTAIETTWRNTVEDRVRYHAKKCYYKPTHI